MKLLRWSGIPMSMSTRCQPMRSGPVILARLSGSAVREPDRQGLFSFLFSTFALMSIIQPHFALNLCGCHGSVPQTYDPVCVRSYGFVALHRVAVSLSRGGHFSLEEIERRAGPTIY